MFGALGVKPLLGIIFYPLILSRGKKILKFSLVPRASTSIFLLVLLLNNLSEMFCPIPSIQGKINLH